MRYETDPTPELSERFNDGRSGAGDAAADARAGPRSVGPNDAVNVAVIGLGSTTAVGGVGGRGHQLSAGSARSPVSRSSRSATPTRRT